MQFRYVNHAIIERDLNKDLKNICISRLRPWNLKSHQSQNKAVSPENADEITIWSIFFVSPDIALYSTALSMVEESRSAQY